MKLETGRRSIVRSAIVGVSVTGLLMAAPGAAAQAAPIPLSSPEFSAGAGVIFVVSGGSVSSPENRAHIQPVAAPLLEAEFTIFHLRHPSTPRYRAPEIYEAVKLGRDHILEHAEEHGVEPARMGVIVSFSLSCCRMARHVQSTA